MKLGKAQLRKTTKDSSDISFAGLERLCSFERENQRNERRDDGRNPIATIGKKNGRTSARSETGFFFSFLFFFVGSQSCLLAGTQ